MSHLPSDIDLDSVRVPPNSGQFSGDSISIVPTEPRNQNIDMCPGAKQLEYVARCLEVQNNDGLQHLLQHRSHATHLPPEILAYIFKLYATRFGEFAPNDASSEGPIYLAQVCTLWKAIAESEPSLWTSIHIYFPESHRGRENDVPRVSLLLNLHLKRSGTLPISLAFTDHRMYHTYTEDLIFLLVDRLRVHSRRWKCISLQLSGGYFPLLFSFTPCDLSSLEHLCVNSNTVMFAHPITLNLNLESATNLKSFTYSGPGPSVEDRIDLHWRSLAEMSFDFAPHSGGSFMSYWRFTDLARCQNITTCSLGIDRPPPVVSRAITLPCLQTLRVRRLSPYAHASGMIGPLVLPQLRTLEIDASSLVVRSESWHDRTFSDLLVRSGCTLLCLSIQDVDFPNDELIRCLALSPQLTSLRFIPCPRSQDISDVIRNLDVSCMTTRSESRIQGAMEHKQGRVASPQLRKIALASSVGGYLESMMAMFRSRSGACARDAGVVALRRVEVVFFDLWHDTEVNLVRRMGNRLEGVESLRADLAQWASENRNESGKVNEDEDQVEVSMVVDSPYLPEYIDFQ